MSMAGFYIASSATKLFGGRKRRKADKKAMAEQERLDLANIQLEKLETEESIRRTLESQGKTIGTQRSQAGASGFGVGSSLDRYIASTQAEHSSDIDWMRTSGASRAAIGEREAAARKDAADAVSKGNYTSSITGAIGSGMSAGVAHNKFGWGFGEK